MKGLAQRGQFIEDRGLAAWPDGTVSGRYRFRHALYQEVLYERLGSGRRMRCHRAIGARLEAGYGAQAAQIAATLAMHFERGRRPRRAVQYRQQAAAENALRRHAYPEAIATSPRGWRCWPPSRDPGAGQQELDLQMALGPALMATKGHAAPEVEQTYARARALCAQVGETPQLFPTLRGLWRFYRNRGHCQRRGSWGNSSCGWRSGSRANALLEAHEALGTTLFYLGEYAAARTHLEQGIALTDPAQQRPWRSAMA